MTWSEGQSPEVRRAAITGRGSVLFVAALGADAVFVQGDAAQRAAVDLVVGLELCGGGVHTAGEGDLGNVQLVLELGEFEVGGEVGEKLELDLDEELDVQGKYVTPGFVDIHIHGAKGSDFCDNGAEHIETMSSYLGSEGITSFCGTTMAFDEPILQSIFETARPYINKETGGAVLRGINMEGPFISPRKLGAQNPAYLHQPDVAMFRRLQKRSGGLIKLVDIAPEEEGAFDFISQCKDEVRISIAHTCTSYDTAIAAFDLGASHMTHLYNAMPGITHREPGPIIAALEKKAEVELITDGVHIHPAMVRFTFNTFGDDRVILIADSMMACGLPDGEYSLGGQAVTVKGPRATLTEQPGVIAGSATCLYDCMKRAVLDMGVALESAVRAASENPARSIGVDADYGSLAVGRYGNVILADKALEIQSVIQKGVRIV